MAAPVPVSTVINLTEVFGEDTETKRFVTRYLRAQHADLFFADAAILVEGPAERMLVPNFIRHRYPRLNQCYVTLLEIGGSHAHRLRPLIEHLGLSTLVITDLDAGDETSKAAVPPKIGEKQITNNATLRHWAPQKSTIDELLAEGVEKVTEHDPLFEIRVAYQIPVTVTWPEDADSTQTALPNTFEDALAFANLPFFAQMAGFGLVRKFRDAIQGANDVVAIEAKMFESLKDGNKAEFALDILGAENFANLTVPQYIDEGLVWLEGQLRKKQVEILSTVTESIPS